MTSPLQRLQGSHIFTNEQDCSYTTAQLDDEASLCSIGVLTHSSTVNTSHDPFHTSTQRFPLYHGETSSSQTSMFSQNQHDHCSVFLPDNQSYPSNPTSLLSLQDLAAADSAFIDRDLMSFVNDQQPIGQASYQRKRQRLFQKNSHVHLYTYFICNYL